jgi:hypothetical protein
MRAIASLVGLLPLIACARSSDGPTAPNERTPVIVPYAPKAAASDEANEAVPERQPGPSERQATGRDDRDDSSEDFQVEVQQDGGVFSFSAKTVRDGGFSFRFSGSVSVSTDGGSVNVTISPDGGMP